MAKYRIDIPKPGAATSDGLTVRLYEAGEEIDATEEWQAELMSSFVANGWASELKVDAPEETKRARKDDGTFQSDDPSTPDVNEAWEGGKAPPPKKKAPRRKAPAKKKTAAKK